MYPEFVANCLAMMMANIAVICAFKCICNSFFNGVYSYVILASIYFPENVT